MGGGKSRGVKGSGMRIMGAGEERIPIEKETVERLEKSEGKFIREQEEERMCFSPIDLYSNNLTDHFPFLFQVERLQLHRSVLSIERTCVQECPYGCKFNGYGLTYMRCISCCNTYACNDGNAAQNLHVNKRTTLVALATAAATVLMFML